MAAERKLKAEIDRTLKKVQEGQEIFDDIWNQYSAHKQAHDQENQNQREKLEGELKKEIKKLQRLREQIKGWIAGADIKDKQPLIDARKSIERDMERFKACEKEAKAKGSAAGGADRDPKQRAKDEARDWINTVVDQLTEKVETMEAEMEELQVTVKKRQKPPARLTALEETVGRHKDHIDRLEKVLRCIDNETIQPDELSDLKEDMDMYLGTEDGEDTGMDMTNVDDMYGVFQDRLDAVDNAAPAAPLHNVKHGKGVREKEMEEAREKERERERAAAAAAKAQLIAQGNTNLKLHDDDDVRKPLASTGSVTGSGSIGGSTSKPATPSPSSTSASSGVPLAVAPLTAPTPAVVSAGTRQTAPSTPAKEPDSVASITSPGLPASEAASPMPPRPPGLTVAAGPSQPAPPPGIMPGGAGPRTPAAAAPAAANGAIVADGAAGVPRWLAAAAAASHAAGGPAEAGSLDGRGATLDGMDSASANGANGLGTAPSPTSGGPGPVGAYLGGQAGGLASTGPAGADAASSLAAAGAGRQAGGGPGPGPGGLSAVDALASRMAGVNIGFSGGPAGGTLGATSSGAAVTGAAGGATSSQAGGAGGGPTSGGPVSGGVLLSGELPPVVPAYSVAAAKQILESCYVRGVMPQLSDTEWKHTRPRHPAAVPGSYPKVPPEVVENPALFRKMDPECLFFAFYFQPSTYQQFLAAHELKRQSWRFHRHHNAWFQRFTEPTVTSEEYEQGAYVYFDYNIVHDDMQTGWCYRRKENFTFRYDALEDELRVASLTPQHTVTMALAQAQGLS